MKLNFQQAACCEGQEADGNYGDLGQHDKALALKESILKLMRSKLGEDHPDTLHSMNNLALMFGFSQN